MKKKHVLNDIIQLYNLTNLVKEPTRINIISGIETLLDPVLVSDDCDCRFVEVIDIDKTISDHKATKLYLKIPDVIHKSYQRLVWIYKKGDFVKFNNPISQFDWYKLLSNRTCFFSCNKSTFRSPVTTTCWVKLNDCSIEC
jgi:hypothetical protein